VVAQAGSYTVPAGAHSAAGVGLDDGQRIVSGEAVELDIRVARLGSRVLAALIDLVLAILVAWGCGIALFFIAVSMGLLDQPIFSSVAIVSLALGFLGFPTAVETLSSGRSLGKAAMGLRVVCDDGGPIRLRHAFTRALLNVAVEFPGLLLPPVTWLATIGVMIANPSGKRIGDLAAGTIVIHERTPASWGWVPPMPPALAGWASTLDLTGLDDRLVLAIRHYLSRNREVREPARTVLGQQLAREVALSITPPPPPTAAGWEYLAAVLAERNRRAMAQMAKARAAADLIWSRLGAAPRSPRASLVAPAEVWRPQVPTPTIAVAPRAALPPAVSGPAGFGPNHPLPGG